jgi:putative membrane protein
MPPDLHEPRRTSPVAAAFWMLRAEPMRALVLAVAAVGGTAYGALSWWRRTWCFADGVLHLDEGIVVRNERRIPVERIQHVELERRLRHQIFGLAAVRVETAGGSGAELTLDSIALAEAELLRSTVLERLRDEQPPPEVDGPGGPLPAPAPPPPPETLVRLPPSRLLLAGVTGPEVVAVLAAIGFAVDLLADLGVDPDELEGTRLSSVAVAALVIVVVPLWFAVAALIGLVRRWDLTAVIVRDELRVTYGLLRRNEFVVKTNRVQDVRISHRMLLRPFGRADVRVRTAASGSTERSRVDVPLLSPAEIDVVLARVMPAALPLPPLQAAPPAARRRAIGRSTAVGAVGAAILVLVALAAGAPVLVAAAVLLLLLSVARGEAYHRGLGMATAAGLVHSQAGTLTRNRSIVPAERVQSASVVASWFQRRRALAHLRLDLAGDAVGVLDREAGEARALLESTLAVGPPGRATAPA